MDLRSFSPRSRSCCGVALELREPDLVRKLLLFDLPEVDVDILFLKLDEEFLNCKVNVLREPLLWVLYAESGLGSRTFYLVVVL